MNDPRIRNLAKTLVCYCIAARKGQTVGVSGGILAAPLFSAVYEELIVAGAFPVLTMAPDGLSAIFYRKGQNHHFTTLTSYQRAYGRCMDATISICSQSNTRALSAVDPKKQVLMSKTLKSVSEILHRKPWVITLFPTEAYAQDAEMSLRAFEDFVYEATFSDEDDPVAAWKAVAKKQDRLIARLRGTDKVRIVGSGTDITLSVKGRKFVNSAGHRNMPSGEIFAAPQEASAEGYVRFDYPVCAYGREISGVRLVFRQGEVVEAHADKHGDFLKSMLNSDPGAKRLGELGIGTNTKIQKFVKSILFDEKIGGTVHLALGRSPLDTGGKNQSAIHWDLIKDLRQGGAIYADGKVFEKNGKFVR
jgi:aminopeptidase